MPTCSRIVVGDEGIDLERVHGVRDEAVRRGGLDEAVAGRIRAVCSPKPADGSSGDAHGRLTVRRSLAPRRSTSRSAWLRALPIAVCGIAVALVLVASASSPPPAIEPDLATLLRGMALVKASIVAVAAVAAGWRFGRPIRLAATLGYLGGLAAMAGATALVWQLTGLVAASIAFHGGLLAVLVVAWRLDPDGSNARRSR